MDTNYISLLNLAYEIEGLLLLHINRGDEASPEMTELLKKKIALLSASYSEETAVAPIAPVAPAEAKTAAKEEIKPCENEAETTVPEIEERERPVETDNEAIARSAATEETEDAEPLGANEEVYVAPTTDENEPERLEDKLSRERAKDIFKAFTINDKFRFRRELFRNSQDEFDETLDVIAQMSNFDEAEEYFYNDLCWDPESEIVKEFMETVRKHF